MCLNQSAHMVEDCMLTYEATNINRKLKKSADLTSQTRGHVRKSKWYLTHPPVNTHGDRLHCLHCLLFLFCQPTLKVLFSLV